MKNTTEKVKKMLSSAQMHNAEKLKKQQDYYKRLTSNGVAKKQSYNVKPISAI